MRCGPFPAPASWLRRAHDPRVAPTAAGTARPLVCTVSCPVPGCPTMAISDLRPGSGVAGGRTDRHSAAELSKERGGNGRHLLVRLAGGQERLALPPSQQRIEICGVETRALEVRLVQHPAEERHRRSDANHL